MRLQLIWPRLGIILALSVGVSCTAGDVGPTDPASAPMSQDIAPATNNVDLISPVDLLLCSPQRYLTTTRVVGSKGGKIKVGSHVLTIPPGALSQDVTIVAEQLTSSVNSVRFGPEGLIFAQPAELTMSYDNCESITAPKKVVYTDDRLKLLEVLSSDDKPQTKTVTSPIDHFSRYAVAY
jgi:hypothetical protein